MEKLKYIEIGHVTPAYIKELRRNLRLTQPQFGEALGYAGAYVSMIESGLRPVTAKFGRAVALLEQSVIPVPTEELRIVV